MYYEHRHRRDECKHGVVIAQCKCMSKEKIIHLVPCPTDDAHGALVDAMGGRDPLEGPEKLVERLSEVEPPADLAQVAALVTEALELITAALTLLRRYRKEVLDVPHIDPDA